MTITIPDSLQTLGEDVFDGCSKLVPYNISVSYDSDGNQVDTTSDVVAYLRSQQRIAELEKMLAERDATIAEQATTIAKCSEPAPDTTTTPPLLLQPPPPPLQSTDDFMQTPEFYRHFLD